MVVNSKTMDALKAVGLNKYERNLWAALLSRGTSTAGELSDISNVPRSRCYDVLESLATKGYVVLQHGKPMKYVAIDPKESLERAKKKIFEDAQEMTAKLDRFKSSDSIKELERVFKNQVRITKPEDITGTLKGRYTVMQQMETMLKNAKKSVNIIATEDSINEIAEAHGPMMKKLADSGIRIKMAIPFTKKTEDVIKSLAGIAEVRNLREGDQTSKLVGRMFIIDDQEFIIGLTDDVKTHHTQDTAIWSQSSHAAANILSPIFNMVWESSKPAK